MMKAVTSVFLFCISVNMALAVGDDFNVSQQINADVTPPTVPTALTATPIAYSQIDLSWNASSDDVELGGYIVYRDAVQIATTTLTTYADSGLTASTTYAYHVRAFDTAYNYSSSSAVVATTTLELPATTTPPVSDSGADVSIDLVSFDINVAIHSAQLHWQTDRYARFELRWGRTSSYELGFVVNEVFKREHETIITGLEPGTTYSFELIAYNRDGQSFRLKRDEFTTEDIADTIPPTNVYGLKGEVDKNDIRLSWSNPIDTDFSYVRIVRSHLFYPTDPQDGFIVYQGNAGSFTDINALQNRRTVYYTAFTYDDKGNVSSGASLLVYPSDVEPPIETVEEGWTLDLSFSDIQVLQNDAIIADHTLDPGVPFLVRIAYEKLPEHLKTITVEFQFPSDQGTQMYLLRINKDKTFYEAHIPGFVTKGTYPTIVSVYDHQTRRAHTLKGELSITKDIPIPTIPIFGGIVGNIDHTLVLDVWFYLLLVLLLCILFEFFRALTRAHPLAKTPLLRSLHMIALFCVGGGVCYTLLSLSASTKLPQEALVMQTDILQHVGILFVYTLLAVLIFVALVSVGIYYKKK